MGSSYAGRLLLRSLEGAVRHLWLTGRVWLTVDLAILSVRVEQQKANPDLALKRALLRQAESSATVALSASFVVKSALPHASFVTHCTVGKDEAQVAQRDFPESLEAQLARTYRISMPYKLDGTDTYLVSVRITI